MAVYKIIPSNNKTIRWVIDHSPQILTYGGIGLMAGSTIAAAVGTKKMLEEKDNWDSNDPIVKKVWNRSKHFVTSTGLFAAGTFCIIKSDGIMLDRNKKLTETIAAMSVASMAYRERWQNKVGKDKEEEVFFDEKTEEIEENGKKKKVKMSNIDKNISTDVYFDRYCSWRADENGDIAFDKKTVKNVMAVVNQELWGSPERMIILNHIYDMLGEFTVNEHGQRVDYRTVAGQVAGWILDKDNPTGDNTILITITETNRRLEDGRIIPTLRLSFNHDGNIMKAAQERGLLG